MSYLRVGHILQLSIKKFTVVLTRCANVMSKQVPCNEQLNSINKLDLENPQCEIPLTKLDKKTLKKYKFPKFLLNYTSEDCVQHALSVGVNKSHPHAKELLTNASNLKVLPSFILPFGNKIMLDLGAVLDYKDKTVHAEQFINIYRPLKAQGEITYELDVVDIVDKAKGTIYIYNLHGHDEMGNKMFLLQYQFYEIGVNNVGRKATNSKSEEMVSPPGRLPDKIFLFKTVELSSTFCHPTPTGRVESIFSVKHSKQHYAVTEKISSRPICHGRYYLGAVMQQILGYYANGNTKLFDKVKTRFSHPVYPGNTILTKSWKIENRIVFESFVVENRKCALKGSYLDLKNNKNFALNAASFDLNFF